jgi:hypothetical protein
MMRVGALLAPVFPNPSHVGAKPDPERGPAAAAAECLSV